MSNILSISLWGWAYAILTLVVCGLIIARAIYVVAVIAKAVAAKDYGCVKAQTLYLVILLAALLFFAWVAHPVDLLTRIIS